MWFSAIFLFVYADRLYPAEFGYGASQARAIDGYEVHRRPESVQHLLLEQQSLGQLNKPETSQANSLAKRASRLSNDATERAVDSLNFMNNLSHRVLESWVDLFNRAESGSTIISNIEREMARDMVDCYLRWIQNMGTLHQELVSDSFKKLINQ